MYDLDLDKAIGIVKEHGYGLVGLQFPEGLTERAVEVVEALRNAGCEAIVSADPCYGACDLADEAMAPLGVQGLLHFGHTPIPGRTTLPVHFIEVRSDADPLPLLAQNIGRLGKKVGLVATVQHLHTLEKVRAFLEEKGIEAHIGGGKGRARYPGQVLGCSFQAAREVAERVDTFLFIGSGDFHPLGVALATGKRTLALDVLMGEVREIEPLVEKVLRQRYLRIGMAKDAKTFGIILGGRRGQARTALATRLKEELEKRGKRAYLLQLREITPEALLPFRKLDAFVNTACPRVAIDDGPRYKKPLLTPTELEMVLGERSQERYEMDEIP